MHEFGLCESFMDAVSRRAAGRSVAGVRVRIGVLHRVDQEALRQSFQFVALGTVAEGAQLELVTTPAVLACDDCGVKTGSTQVLAICPACGGTALQIVGGTELVLESIRLADVDAESAHGAPVGTVTAAEEPIPPEPDDGHSHDAVAIGGG